MAYQMNLFDMPWYYLLITFIIVVGVINAYNFMDGINGITACYSLAVGGLLMICQSSDYSVQIQVIISIVLLIFMSLIYLALKNWVIKKYVKKINYV